MSEEVLQITGFEEFEAAIEELQDALDQAPEIITGQISEGIARGLMILQGQAAIYPPAPPGIERTGILGKRWAFATRAFTWRGRDDAGVTGTVGNNTWYGPRVMGSAGEQEEPWIGIGWRSIDDIADAASPQIQQLLIQAGMEATEKIMQEAAG